MDLKEELKIMEDLDEFYKEMAKEENAIFNYNKSILKELRKKLGGKYTNDIKECLEISCAEGKLEIVDNPGIKPQEEDWRSFDHVLVDQYCNGGYVGDDFAGYVYIPIGENKYLKSHYSM